MTGDESGRGILPRLMTVAAAAEELGCSAEHLHRAIRARRLACYRLGRLIRVTPEQIAAYVESSLCPAQDPRGHVSTAGADDGASERAVEALQQTRRVNRALDRPSPGASQKASVARKTRR